MTRQPRSDAKLRSLPPEHRAKVDRWLFDKGLSYQQVAQACFESFGLTLSRSSVARYFQTETLARIEQQRQARRRTFLAEPSPYAHLSADECYSLLLAKITDLALLHLETSAAERDNRLICRLVSLLIAARRERHAATRAAVHRAEFETWAAAQVLDHFYESQGRKERPGTAELKRRKLRTITWREQCGFTNPDPSPRRRKPTALDWRIAERNGFNTLHYHDGKYL